MQRPSESKDKNKTKANIQKYLSHFVIHGLLEDQPETPPKHIVLKANKAPKVGGSEHRAKKKWVIKPNDVNPKYKRWAKESYGVDITNNTKTLAIDIILSEYANCMSETGHKTRVIKDEKECLNAKGNTFITGLKTFADLLGINQYAKELEQLEAQFRQAGPRYLNVCGPMAPVYFNIGGEKKPELTPKQKTIQDKMNVLTAKIESIISLNKIISHSYSPDKRRTLITLAETCVTLERLDVGDLHGNNIGLDQFGNVSLFDLEHGLDKLQGELDNREPRWVNVKKLLSDTHFFENLTSQPNPKYFSRLSGRMDGDEIKNLADNFKKNLGPINAAFFQRRINRRWLKEMLCPKEFFTQLTDACTTSEFKELGKLIADYLSQTQELLSKKLLQNEHFCRYLLKDSIQDMNEILIEFEKLFKTRPHLLDENTELTKLIDDVRNTYMTIIHDLQDKKINEFIKNRLEQPKLSLEAQSKLLADLKAATVETKDEKTVQSRQALLKQTSASILQLAEHPDFDAKKDPFKKIIKTIRHSPEYMYRLLLTAIYTNATAAIKLLLPEFLKLKNPETNAPYHDVNDTDQFGRTLLHHAVIASDLDAVKILMASGARLVNKAGPGRPLNMEMSLTAHPPIVLFVMENYPEQFEKSLHESYLGKDSTQWMTSYATNASALIKNLNTLSTDGSISFGAGDIDLLKTMSFFNKPRLGNHQLTTHERDRLRAAETEKANETLLQLSKRFASESAAGT